MKIDKYVIDNGIFSLGRIRIALILVVLFCASMHDSLAQGGGGGNLFRLGQNYIRIAEAGQLIDTVSIWGDVSGAGNYIVPRGTTLAELIGFARGPARNNTLEVQLDWSSIRIEVSVTDYGASPTDKKEYKKVSFMYTQSLPSELNDIKVKNKSYVVIEVKRKPVLADWLRVIAPTISTILATFVLIDRILSY